MKKTQNRELNTPPRAMEKAQGRNEKCGGQE